MYIVPIAWLYVALMMAVAEATHSSGTLLGASITFVFYGVAPVAMVMYLMRAPARRRAIKARDASERATPAHSAEPDTSRHPATDAVTPVRKKP